MAWKKAPGLGDRVLITGNHPHAGKIGTYDRSEQTMFGVFPVVVFDDGTSCFVMGGVEWKRVGINRSWTPKK